MFSGLFLSFEFVHIDQMPNIPHGFIEMTCLKDGKRCIIRSDLIGAVYENGPTKEDFGVKPAHTEVCYESNKTVEVVESYDEVLEKMYYSEL